MQNFINTMGDLCEFTFIEGTKNVTREGPIKYFVDKGIEPPYKRWFIFNKPIFRSLPDGSTRVSVFKTDANLDDVLESNLYIIEFMNRQDEPFDGFAGFSQGGQVLQTFFKNMRYFKKHMWMRYPMPYFYVDLNVPNTSNFGTYEYLNSSFVSGDIFVPCIDSLHFVSDNDIFKHELKCYLRFEKPVIIHHTQGHRPVSILPKEDLTKVGDFFVK